MNNYIKNGKLKIDEKLYTLVNEKILPHTKIKVESFWKSFEALIYDLAPINKELLETRDNLQKKIDNWHTKNKVNRFNFTKYKTFLKDIGYLVQEKENFKITTQNVDTEIKEQAGPQLVVPIKNARFALNAANARWGSLYDALYGTDAISQENAAEISKEYNPIRGEKVVEFAKKFLDDIVPLKKGSHFDVVSYTIVNNDLVMKLKNEEMTVLKENEKFLGYQGTLENPTTILLKNHNLHLEIQLDKTSLVGKNDLAGVKDLVLESAVSTIMDCEDSVAAVDAQDKVEVYENWLGLMLGKLEDSFIKNGKVVQRKLNDDRVYKTTNGEDLTLHGRSLLFVRNVGHLMTNPAILFDENKEIPEGIMDAMITVLAAIPDINQQNTKSNSRTKSIYIVKPKMHGPDEVAFAVKLFEYVENALELPKNTIKIGIMDEERRTTVNLKECIRNAAERTVFINTGFLDRTGDEIHTSMLAGAFLPKGKIKNEPWIKAYEQWNVDIGLECGLQGVAQIGKGMWAMPDEMANMLEEKINHPKAGATTAWVPSPIGATLHSIHYHKIDVFDVQKVLEKRERASLDDILTIPLLEDISSLTKQEIQDELENNAQGLLGYVVRWIDEGIGCSKVLDINNVALMEDRATLRISSQHLCNWLEHNVCTKEQVLEALQKMAKVVDTQNINTKGYINMAPSYDGIAFKAACDLIFKGKEQPSGYTEPLLHEYRRKYKELV